MALFENILGQLGPLRHRKSSCLNIDTAVKYKEIGEVDTMSADTFFTGTELSSATWFRSMENRRAGRAAVALLCVAFGLLSCAPSPIEGTAGGDPEWVHARFEQSPGFERITPGRSFMFYHHHVPKTAGRSLYRYFLKEGHPEGIEPCTQVLHPGTQPGETDCLLFGGRENFCRDLVSRLKDEELRTSQYETCNFLSFESQNLTWDLTQHLTMPRLKVVTMFREPIAHYVSQFMHDRAWGRVSTMSEYLSQTNTRGYNVGTNGNLIHQRMGVTKLQEAKDLVHDKMFFFGFMEYWPQSVCLLSYQLRQFDRAICNLCHREDLVKPTEGFSMSERYFLGSKRVGVKSDEALSEAALTVQELRQVQDINADDLHLYTWAVEIFKARLRHVERAEGVKLLCDE